MPDYTAVGHVTIDLLPDHSRQAGGSAFYSALQASRLGLHARIITRGVVREIEELLEPYRPELELEIQPATQTTTLHTTGSGDTRSQRVLAWAGPIEEGLYLDTSILHLAPVARETPARWRGRSDFVGLTPQGLARSWPADGGQIGLCAPSDEMVRVAERCDALVVSELERVSCSTLIAQATHGGAIAAITAGAQPGTILLPDGSTLAMQAPSVERPRDDLGAGDVFAAGFFVALVEGLPAEEAARFASAAAAARLGGVGPGAIGDRVAIERLVEQTREVH